MTTSLQQQLSTAWSSLHTGSSEAIEWIDAVRDHAPSLANEADALKLELYRHKNLAQSLAHVATTPMTVGFFGLSQAGKSYLISALAADPEGKLITNFGGEELDFLSHVNPTGGGKEATGLVTRFSRLAQPSPDSAYPIELNLFKEIEIAMILANAWFNDFDQELVNYDIDEALISAHLQAFADTPRASTAVSTVAPEDIVALMDYLGDKRSVNKLKALYWPEALRSVPYLNLQERAQFLSILWGKQQRLTQVYVQLAEVLERIGSTQTVYAPLNALVQKEGDEFFQRNSIMNVDTLNLLGTAQDTPLFIRPSLQGELQAPVSINTAQLTALVSEMTFQLIRSPQDAVVEKVDLLDFPGYRSRLKMPNTTALTEQKDIIAQLLLRGKVSYLFERYTNRQEMNGLIMCTNSNKQSEVVDVEKVLSDWIQKTQGATATERSQRQPGLMWAMTMMDMFVENACELSSSQRVDSCSNLLHITMLERFGKSDWMVDWDGKPFNNAFLVRKPRLRTTFLDLDANKNETGISQHATTAVHELRDSFCANSNVQKHVNNPEQAWDSMMRFNDGGITHLGQGIEKVADPSFKLQRIQEQLDEIQSRIKTSLGRWFHQDADDAEAVQREKAQHILRHLGSSTLHLPEMMKLLSLDDTEIRNLYHSLSSTTATDDTTEQAAATSPQNDFMADFAIDLGFSQDTAAPTEKKETPPSTSHQFSNSVFSAWITHLRHQGTKHSALSTLGISEHEKVIPDLVQELITAANRLGLPEKIAHNVNKRVQSNARHEQVAMRYVSYAQSSLHDFISYLGYLDVPAEKRLTAQNSTTPLFQFPKVTGHALPVLAEQSQLPLMSFLSHWLWGLYHLIIENAGHSAGREITIQQNEQLGKILHTMGAR